ncbi:MAG: class I SAM-dependent methyltransferase [Bryobacteraceae bacterium]
MKLYGELAAWWPLFSAPGEYEEEAAAYAHHLAATGDGPAETLVEFGAGGGNNAWFLKRRFRSVTLVDISPAMIDVSSRLNPDCEHAAGDMRTARLGRQFDRVFIHDAVCYMTTLDDLRQAVETAYLHCRPGGGALFAPDYTRETFEPSTDCGGADGDGRALRYLEWVHAPAADESVYRVDYVVVLREANGAVRVERDEHVEGLFARDEWLAVLRGVGFVPRAVEWKHSAVDRPLPLFAAVRPA